jgi:hypothetical protein
MPYARNPLPAPPPRRASRQTRSASACRSGDDQGAIRAIPAGEMMMFATDAVTDLASSRAFLQPYAERAAAHGIWADGTLVGGGPLSDDGRRARRRRGRCWLEPAAVDKGLVTRAVRLLIDWAVDERSIHRVEWRVSGGSECERTAYTGRATCTGTAGSARRSARYSHLSGGRPRASVAQRDLEQQRRALAQGALELERAAEGLGPVPQTDEP